MPKKLVFIKDINWCPHCPADDLGYCGLYGKDSRERGKENKPKWCKVTKSGLIEQE